MVLSYYRLLYSGDLTNLSKIMTQSSYFLTLESFGLSLAIRDASFKELLDKIKDDTSSLKKAESMLSKDLAARQLSPKIEIVVTEENGVDRKSVHYHEDGQKKQLHFSKEDGEWKINYFAGRKLT